MKVSFEYTVDEYTKVMKEKEAAREQLLESLKNIFINRYVVKDNVEHKFEMTL